MLHPKKTPLIPNPHLCTQGHPCLSDLIVLLLEGMFAEVTSWKTLKSEIRMFVKVKVFKNRNMSYPWKLFSSPVFMANYACGRSDLIVEIIRWRIFGVGSNAEFCTLLFFLLLRGPCTANYLVLEYISFAEMQYNRVPYCQCLFYFTTLRDEDSVMRIMIQILLDPFFLDRKFENIMVQRIFLYIVDQALFRMFLTIT